MVKLFPSAVIAVVLVVAQPGAGRAQTPTFRVEVWAEAAPDFAVRVDAYFELRRRLESRLPDVTVTDDVGRIRRARHTLALAIRAARPGAVQGEFFTAATRAHFQAALARAMNASMWEAIMDDNPGSFGHDIDGTYPDDKPFSTVPGSVLARLPELPDDIQFRFVGRHLILYDVRANTIIDRMPDAIGAPRAATERGARLADPAGNGGTAASRVGERD